MPAWMHGMWGWVAIMGTVYAIGTPLVLWLISKAVSR